MDEIMDEISVAYAKAFRDNMQREHDALMRIFARIAEKNPDSPAGTDKKHPMTPINYAPEK